MKKNSIPPKGSSNLLQKAKAVSDLVDVVVCILPGVDVHPILPALWQTQHRTDMIIHNNSIRA